MTVQAASQKRIDDYLGTVRRRLRALADAEAAEIVAELRSHILDRSAAGGEVTPERVEAALAALGSPEDLASQYVTEDLMARAQVSRSPIQIMRSLLHWSALSVAGFFVCLGAFLGYFASCALILGALLKPFHPAAAGLWRLPGGAISLHMGFGQPPPGATEILGWWLIPVGLLVGYGLFVLTTRFALWSVRRYRRSAAARRIEGRSSASAGEAR